MYTLLATKAIPKGEEIYLSYGPHYWSKDRRFNKLNAVDKDFSRGAILSPL